MIKRIIILLLCSIFVSSCGINKPGPLQTSGTSKSEHRSISEISENAPSEDLVPAESDQSADDSDTSDSSKDLPSSGSSNAGISLNSDSLTGMNSSSDNNSQNPSGNPSGAESTSEIVSGLDYSIDHVSSRHDGSYYFYEHDLRDGIFKKNLESNDPEVQINTTIRHPYGIWVVDGWVYVQSDDSSGNYSLYRMDSDGNNQTKYYSGYRPLIAIEGSWILTVDQKGMTNCLIMISVDNSKTIEIGVINENNYLGCSGGYFYFPYRRVPYLTDNPVSEKFSGMDLFAVRRKIFYSSDNTIRTSLTATPKNIEYEIDSFFRTRTTLPILYMSDYISFVKADRDSAGKILNYYRVAVRLADWQETRLFDIAAGNSDYCTCDPDLNYIYHREQGSDSETIDLVRYQLETGEKDIIKSDVAR